jgi:predicted dehydrogenase
MSVNRRKFFYLSAATAAASTRVFAANDRPRIGVIGAGNRSNLLIDQLPESAEIVALADCFLKRAHDAAAKRNKQWRIYPDHRRLLDDKDIDGVIIGTTDHARALCSIHACQAGKDVYAEKPLTVYLAEGRAIVSAARRYNRIFQVGSQQRSMAMNRLASDFVRNGGLGKIHFVEGVNYTGPRDYTPLPAEPVPDTLNWDLWLNAAPHRPYHPKLHTAWMQWRDYSGGEMTNWGAHGLDQIQTALGTDGTGPVELYPLPDAPGAVGFRYANGIPVRLVMPAGQLNAGAVFVGEKGRLEIIRNNFRTDPPDLVKQLPEAEEVNKWKDERALWQARYHMQDWLDCMRTRKQPLADVEAGHRSISLSHLANITRKLGRKLQWNPAAEQFTGDREANALLVRERRKGYELPAV